MTLDAEPLAGTVTATLSPPPDSPLGFAHFVAQADVVGQTLLALLLLMSLMSWAVIVLKALNGLLQRRQSQRFIERFWNAPSLSQVAAELADRPAGEPRDPYSQLTLQALQAQAHHARHGATRLGEAGSASDFVTRTLRKALDAQVMRLENGQSLLATIGATAPFVGLFGTVWGVYHALLTIGAGGTAGPGSLSQIAGPVGEALIMTGLGLAVAIPAVMAYNLYTRRNRVVAAQLDAFASELHTFVAMGQPLGARAVEPEAVSPTAARPLSTLARCSGPVAA